MEELKLEALQHVPGPGNCGAEKPVVPGSQAQGGSIRENSGERRNMHDKRIYS